MNMKDENIQPTIEDFKESIQNHVFDEFLDILIKRYDPLYKVSFSKDTYAYGWNLKLRKAGKALCVLYPHDSYFTVLVVIGRKEKEIVENQLDLYSSSLQKIYKTTREGNSQRWLMIDIYQKNELFEDVLKLIDIRRNVK